MFDWPDPSHTSPTITSLITMLFAPAIVISSGPAAVSGFNQASHLPFAADLVDTLCPWNSTRTASPGSAEPQIRTGMPSCNTMWSEITDGSLTAAERMPASGNRSSHFATLDMRHLETGVYNDFERTIRWHGTFVSVSAGNGSVPVS